MNGRRFWPRWEAFAMERPWRVYDRLAQDDVRTPPEGRWHRAETFRTADQAHKRAQQLEASA